MAWRRSLSWVLTLVLALPILTSCKDDGDPILAKELKNMKGEMSQAGAESAQRLLDLQKRVQETLRDNPRLRALPDHDARVTINRARQLHATNQQETMRVLDAQGVALRALADEVKVISAKKFNAQMTPQQIAETESLTLVNLLMLRDLSQAAARRVLYVMTKFDRSYFDQLEENAAMKQHLLSEYTSALAISAISANDLRATLTQLNEMRQAALLAPKAQESITKLVGHFGGGEKAKRQEVNQFLNESITGKAQESLTKAMNDYHQAIQGKSFLFDPAQPDHPLIHILVIVSNLSWGLVNTLVGLGFVITAAILAPITQVAGATVRAFGYEPMFMEMRFPRLAIAENNMQIYADVCGLGIVPGKMSAGLFELDFCTDYSFASDHEGGHSKQSAILGPLYFPAAILSYILNMGHGGFIEEWADVWAVS